MKFKNQGILSLLMLFLMWNLSIAQEMNNDFRIGMYSLQSPVGTKGFQTGHLEEIIEQVNLAKMGGVNSAIPYRSWDRINYPNWDFFGFVKNYMSDLYKFTKSGTGEAGIQALTPALYSIFLSPPISKTPEDDSFVDRKINKRLFRKFVKEILQTEINIVVQSTSSDSIALNILFDKFARPFGGWYLDDEPFVRNHDVGVLEEMAAVIKSSEEDVFYSNELFSKVPDKYLTKYYHSIFIAFDGDDLHKYKRSGRPEDGKVYNYNGVQYPFPKDSLYTILPPATIDVILVDFYHQDITFWKKIIDDINTELRKNYRSDLKVIPIIKASFNNKYKRDYSEKYFRDLLELIANLDVSGLWIYQWNSSNKDVIPASAIWNDEKINLSQKVSQIFGNRKKTKENKKGN